MDSILDSYVSIYVADVGIRGTFSDYVCSAPYILCVYDSCHCKNECLAHKTLSTIMVCFHTRRLSRANALKSNYAKIHEKENAAIHLNRFL